MTTEVLRNMIYAASPALDGPPVRRARRGALPAGRLPRPGVGGGDHPPAPPVRRPGVPVGDRVERRGARRLDLDRARPTAAIIEEKRPGRAAQPLHGRRPVVDRDLHLLPTLVDGRPNPEAAASTPKPCVARATGREAGGRTLYTPNRLDVIDRLGDEGMLPAIYFIFSRAACDDAVKRCVDAGIRLTTPEERERIRAICEERTSSLTDDDLDVLQWSRWITGMEAGVAVPPRRHGPAVQGGGRGVLHRRPREGGLRHRDARPRHQHAGPPW